jgi:hypothetical protein
MESRSHWRPILETEAWCPRCGLSGHQERLCARKIALRPGVATVPVWPAFPIHHPARLEPLKRH